MVKNYLWDRHIAFGVILWIALAGNVNAQTETYSWNNVAIGGGGFVSGIITSKTEQDLLYARTDVGGAYRWDKVSGTWIPLLDWVSENETGYLGVESIATDPVEPNKVYLFAGTSYFNGGKTAILRSTDYGNTFSITDVTAQFKAHGNGMGRQTGEKLVVDPNSNAILFCGSREKGLFKSSNSGVDWTRLNGLNMTTTTNGNGISFVVLDPSTGSSGSPTQTLIAGISRTGENIYRSDDGGVTFSAVPGAPTTLMPHRAVLTAERNLYVTYASAAGPWDITTAGQIWKYNLQSKLWTNLTPSGFTGSFGGISVDPDNSLRLIASSINTYQAQDGSWGDRIFITTNGGVNWTDIVARGFDLNDNGIPWINGQAIHWAGSIEFDPFNTKKAWVISGNGVFRTDDIDATVNVWKFQVKGMEETVPLDITSVPNGPLVSAIGDYDGFRHTDISQYAPIHAPRMGTTTSIAVASRDPRVMLRAGDHMFVSNDMGLTWTETSASGTFGKVAISADGKVFLHSPENSNTTYRSIDRGAHWDAVTGLTLVSAHPVADPVNSSKFYAYNSTNGSFSVSSNGGVSFTAAGSPGSGGSKIIRTVYEREGDIWIALYNGGLTRSVNSGQNFEKINNVTTCTAVGFGKESPGKTFPTIYIWGTVNGILGLHRSVDEGTTWKRINDDNHEYGGPGNGQFVVGDKNVFGRVYMSTAGRGIIYGESDQACVPDLVIPNIGINGDVQEQTSVASVLPGDDVLLAPEAADGGSWSWAGPEEFTSTDREVILENTEGAQAGIYNVTFTNAAGCESAVQTFTLNVVVKAENILVKGEGNVSAIDEKDGTLQLVAEITPATATDKSVTWSITDGGDFASLSSSGLLTALEDGVVTVKATANDGSGISGEAEITITNQAVTSIERSVDSRFGIYPNPVTTVVMLRYASGVKEVSFYDIQGRSIKTVSNNKNESMSILLDEFPQGVYVMKIITTERTSYIRRLIKCK